jgi:S1-C subfamily serine protease
LKVRCAWLATLFFLPLGQQSSYAQEIKKHSANRPEHTATAEQIFQKVALRLAVLRASKTGELHSLASAIVLTSDGFLGTNYHAIQGADEVDVSIPASGNEGRRRALGHVRLMYFDSSKDLAILKAEVSGLPFLDCSTDPTLDIRVGEKVYALGNPRGLESTISDGIVSGLRTIDGQDVIQHTAPISPGSSGGALIDSHGVLLGMNSWQLRDSQNLNFAIPRKYLFEALTQALHATADLGFPKDDPINDDEFGSRAWKALAHADYIQAINQGTQAIAAGKSSTEVYAILGAAYFESGNKQEAEKYLQQCLLLAGKDDEFKQTARLYLLQILAEKFRQDPASVDRTAVLKLANDFLDSEKTSIVDDAYYQEMKRWAASIPDALKAIVGSWKDASDSESLGSIFNDNEYQISLNANGGFDLTLKRAASSNPLTLSVFGTITLKSGVAKGTLERDLMASKDGSVGLARQSITVELKLTDDMMSLEGMAAYGNIRSSGNMADLVSGFMKTRNGQYRIKLFRSR